MPKKFVTAAQMRKIEELSVRRYGVAVEDLMEQAGLACADELLKQRGVLSKPVLVFCGAGNNGGDGFVIARSLFCRGVNVRVFHFPSSKPMSPEARANYQLIRKLKIPYKKNPSITVVQNALRRNGWAVDALFGIGLSRPLTGKMLQVVEALNQARNSALSVDIPSGLNADTGEALGSVVQADLTVTFGVRKQAFSKAKVKKYTGRILLKEICFPPQLLR